MIVRRLGPLSLAKVAGGLYGFIGLLVGCIFELISMAGGAASNRPGGPVFGALFGLGAIVFLPIVYGCLGFLMSLLMAALYNGVAGMVGGIEIQVEPAGAGADARSPQGR